MIWLQRGGRAQSYGAFPPHEAPAGVVPQRARLHHHCYCCRQSNPRSPLPAQALTSCSPHSCVMRNRLSNQPYCGGYRSPQQPLCCFLAPYHNNPRSPLASYWPNSSPASFPSKSGLQYAISPAGTRGPSNRFCMNCVWYDESGRK